MKAIHVGNLANLPYRFVKSLRKVGFDAELLIPLIHDPTEDPRWEDPELFQYGFPEWILLWDNTHPLRKLHLIRTIRKYDIIHAYTMLSIAALFSLKPYIAHSTGSDLRELALQNTRWGLLMREAFRRSKILLFGAPDLIRVIRKLNIRNARFIPQPIDVKRYVSRKVELKSKYNCETLLFHPSGLNWSLKGSDLFLKAYVRLIKEVKDVFLLLIDWGIDKERTKRFLKEAGAAKHVKFLPLLDHEKLIKHYNAADIIISQFVVGSIGLITLEAMSCGKPVMVHVSEEYYKLCYPELPPVVNAQTEDQIFEKLYDLVTDESKRRQIGKKSQEWVSNYHHWKKVSKNLIKIYESLS